MYLMMKIISMNIRGVRGAHKRKYLRELIHKEQAGMVCLQEIKCKDLGSHEIFKMWGSNEIEWVVNGNVNNVEGVITMWRKSCFCLRTVFNGSNYSIIEGEWRLEEPIQTVVVNIYNTGSVLEKKAI